MTRVQMASPWPGGKAQRLPEVERLFARVEPQENGCWLWRGRVTREGYGYTGFRGVTNVPAHRAIYTLLVGPIPPGLTLDHLCHSLDRSCIPPTTCMHRLCVNPDHLEPVTAIENARRSGQQSKTHCKHGHPFAGDNVRHAHGQRYCMTCRRAQDAAGKARRRAEKEMVK